jgi:hypothetical protein
VLFAYATELLESPERAYPDAEERSNEAYRRTGISAFETNHILMLLADFWRQAAFHQYTNGQEPYQYLQNAIDHLFVIFSDHLFDFETYTKTSIDLIKLLLETKNLNEAATMTLKAFKVTKKALGPVHFRDPVISQVVEALLERGHEGDQALAQTLLSLQEVDEEVEDESKE